MEQNISVQQNKYTYTKYKQNIPAVFNADYISNHIINEYWNQFYQLNLTSTTNKLDFTLAASGNGGLF